MSDRLDIVTTADLASCPIHPRHIDTTRHWSRAPDARSTGPRWNAFGQCEAEVSARWIVRMFQDLRSPWRAFTFDEINGFYQRTRGDTSYSFSFNGLVDSDLIEKSADLYWPTVGFIARCYGASPARVGGEVSP